MTNPIAPIDRIRQLALQLPGIEERSSEGGPAFFVAGTRFAQVRGDMLILIGSDRSDRTSLDVAGDIDWALVEDELAQSWELAAPQELLEAGGR